MICKANPKASARSEASRISPGFFAKQKRLPFDHSRIKPTEILFVFKDILFSVEKHQLPWIRQKHRSIKSFNYYHMK